MSSTETNLFNKIRPVSNASTKKIIDKFQGKHDIDYILEAISSAKPRSNQKLHLETFLRVLTRFSLRAPREVRQLFYKMEKEIEDNLKKIDRDNKIDTATEIQIQRSKKRVKKKHLRLVKN